MKTRDYTVVVARPHSVGEANDSDPATDVYTALVKDAADLNAAIRAGQQEAYTSDEKDWGKRAMRRWELSPADYQMVLVFEGIQRPVAFGWESGRG
jgi:hypothetical protein